jgi:hypothetical protein
MVMTIPPLTNTALALSQSSQASRGDVTLAQQYIELLAQMTDHFNTVSGFTSFLRMFFLETA